MANQKFTLDDILNEFSSPSNSGDNPNHKTQSTSVGIKESNAGTNSFIPESFAKPAEQPHIQPPQREQSVSFGNDNYDMSNDSDDGYSDYDNDEQSNNNNVSQMPKSILDRNITFADKFEESVSGAPADDDAFPNIRPMSNSTRARELKTRNKKKRLGHKVPQTKPSYEKETPHTVYAKDMHKKRRKKDSESPEARSFADFGLNIPKKAPEVPLENQQKEEYVTNSRKGKVDNFVLNMDKPAEQTNNSNFYDYEQNNPPPKNKKRKAKPSERADNMESILSEVFELKGNIIFRIIILVMMLLVSTYISIANDFKLPILKPLNAELSPESFIFVQLTLVAIATMSSISVIKSGVVKLFTLNADCDSMSALASLSCIFTGFVAIFNPTKLGHIELYMPIAILSLLFNAFGKLLIVTRASRNYEFLSGIEDKYAVTFVEDERRADNITRGTLGDYPVLTTMRKTNSLVNSLKYTYSSDIADKFCKFAVPAIFVLSIIISIFCTRKMIGPVPLFSANSLCVGASIFSMCISAAACLAASLIANIPMASAAKKYTKNQGALLGYQSVEDFYDTNSVMVDVEKLFPQGMVNLSAIKIFSDTKIDDAIIMGASLTKYANSILKDMFNNVIVGQEKILYPVENYVYEDAMGICGWINNRRVLLGTRELMVTHNIEGIPTKTKEMEYTENGKDALYMSVSGNLAAMFIIEINASREVKYWLKQLERHDVCIMIKSIDSIISIARISYLFEYPAEMIKIIPSKLHGDFDEETRKVKKQSASLVCTGKFSTLAQLIIGTKTIRQASMFGMILQAATALLGVIIGTVFIFMGAAANLTPSMLMIYNLISAILTIGFISLKRP